MEIRGRGQFLTKIVLVIGSAPEAVQAREFDTRRIDRIVAINNAWRIRSDWTHLVHPEDFPEDRRPRPAPGQQLVTYQDYVPANNRFGGIVYAGGTMVFSAGYWALDALRPDILAFCGCDMVYDRHAGPSHFYGVGQADPLRADPTLQSLEAKANRLAILAAGEGCPEEGSLRGPCCCRAQAPLSLLLTSRRPFRLRRPSQLIDAQTLGDLCQSGP